MRKCLLPRTRIGIPNNQFQLWPSVFAMLESALLCLGSFAAGCCSRGWVPRFKRRGPLVRFWNRSLSAARKGRALHGRGETSPVSPTSPRSPSKATSVAESRASADSEARKKKAPIFGEVLYNPQSTISLLLIPSDYLDR